MPRIFDNIEQALLPALQDPNDEPASVLLERIKAEREKNKLVNKIRTRNEK